VLRPGPVLATVCRDPSGRKVRKPTRVQTTRVDRPPDTAYAASTVPALDAHVVVPAGRYEVGEPGEERACELAGLRIGRWPVTNRQLRAFAEATGRRFSAREAAPELADHPATDVTLADAEAFCAWAAAELGSRVRLPTGDEWEAAARGADRRSWPWGDVFDPDRCACAESGWGWTRPVTAHPQGAGPFGTEQQAGNVWEWVADRAPDGWAVVRGGSYLDHAWGLRASRALPADPERATATTGFRIVIEKEGG
jgi:formylglycine-generating enzyme required for sulfatase activity